LLTSMVHDEVIAQVCDWCWGSGKDPCCKDPAGENVKTKVVDLFEALKQSLQESVEAAGEPGAQVASELQDAVGHGYCPKAEVLYQAVDVAKERDAKAAALRELEAEVSKAIDELLACPVTDSERSLGVGLGVVEGDPFVEDLDVCCANVLKAIAPLRKRVGK
jgi:hypothetical protein